MFMYVNRLSLLWRIAWQQYGICGRVDPFNIVSSSLIFSHSSSDIRRPLKWYMWECLYFRSLLREGTFPCLWLLHLASSIMPVNRFRIAWLEWINQWINEWLIQLSSEESFNPFLLSGCRMQLDFKCTLWYWQGLKSHLDRVTPVVQMLQKSRTSSWEQSATVSVWDFCFCSCTTTDPSISTGSLFFLTETFPLLFTSVQQALARQVKLGPECLDVLVVFSPGLQKTARFTLSLNSITVSVLFCCLMHCFSSFFFFFGGGWGGVKGEK